MYTVIGTPMSRSFRVLWALEELGQPYELTPALPQSPEIREVNASGKVPAMIAEGEVITDSTAILTYLADKHGKLTAPAGTMARAHQDAMTQRFLDELDAVLWTAARHSFALPKEQRVPEVKPSLKWEFNRNLDQIAALIKGPYVMGEAFSLADIVLTHCLNWAYGAKFPVENQAMLAYGKSMRARPAHQRVAALIKK
ncbi:glutathione S-transferase family protein [Phaeobacter sp. 11ANDIMAR09]|uniref:glutathione S-transferase family protein n=1 Tax=Phaeobacter sp. 11ANDIMAR09 TaxID=1225647 RepID=UPI0006C85D94|nr:glutathione S-transferase family protein [Phaeobacter sp. 11ANDIMAR09]KPD12127.1 glutathione S-transferase [Phaeobacter sp. 11ANDIMAR09]OIQ33776.1 MAG: glutathione S-transferase [Roseobacter sp. MedPE-SWchi]